MSFFMRRSRSPPLFLTIFLLFLPFFLHFFHFLFFTFFLSSSFHLFIFFPSCFVWPLRAAACASTRSASVAGSAPHHQRTADVAGGRISHLDKFPERSNRIRAIGIHRWLSRHWNGLEQFALVTRQKPEFEPTRDVVHERLGVADLWISGPTAWLEAHVAEFFAKHAQWDAVLQCLGSA